MDAYLDDLERERAMKADLVGKTYEFILGVRRMGERRVYREWI